VVGEGRACRTVCAVVSGMPGGAPLAVADGDGRERDAGRGAVLGSDGHDDDGGGGFGRDGCDDTGCDAAGGGGGGMECGCCPSLLEGRGCASGPGGCGSACTSDGSGSERMSVSIGA